MKSLLGWNEKWTNNTLNKSKNDSNNFKYKKEKFKKKLWRYWILFWYVNHDFPPCKSDVQQIPLIILARGCKIWNILTWSFFPFLFLCDLTKIDDMNLLCWTGCSPHVKPFIYQKKTARYLKQKPTKQKIVKQKMLIRVIGSKVLYGRL